MKKIVLVFILEALTTTINAQNVKPTKKEAIDFIASKLMKYITNDARNITYKDGVLSFDFIGKWKDGIVRTETYAYNLNSISSYDFEYIYPVGVTGAGKVGYKVKGKNIECFNQLGKWYCSDDMTINDKNRFDISLESGLVNRIKNALNDIINSNNANEKY